MSANAATVQTRAEEAGEAHALAFRIAFAAAVGLTLGEVLGWDFPFLPAMLAVQLLSGRGPVSVKQGGGFVILMVAACAFAVLVSQIFGHSPVLLLLISLLIFLERRWWGRRPGLPLSSLPEPKNEFCAFRH